MKTNSGFWRALAVVLILFTGGAAFAQTKVTYDVTGVIDVADLLIIHGSTMQWHHPGSGAAVGRHLGGNIATTISSTVNGAAELDQFSWIPTWPAAPPAEIRRSAFSSVLNGVAPGLPSENATVEVSVLSGRGSVSVEQLPEVANDWTLIVRFADGFPGAALLSARISVESASLPAAPVNVVAPQLVTADPMALQITPSDSSHFQIAWPTNAVSYELETTTNLPAMIGDWMLVTGQPVVLGPYFVMPVDMSEPRRFFRLRQF